MKQKSKKIKKQIAFKKKNTLMLEAIEINLMFAQQFQLFAVYFHI